MNISRLLIPFLLLGLLLFIASACGNGVGPSTPAGTELNLAAFDDPSAGEKAFDPSQELLEWIFNQGTDSEIVYEVAVSGEISIDDGGYISGTPASWPFEYRFVYYVKPGSIDRSSLADSTADSVTITIRVPVMDTVFPSEAEEVMPMILEPDGLRYRVPEDAQTPEEETMWCADVLLAYHPALPPSCQAYEVFSADETAVSGVYFVEENYLTHGEAPASNILKRLAEADHEINPIVDLGFEWMCATGIYAKIMHHSRWGVVKNDGGGDGTPIVPDMPDLLY